MLQSVVNTKFLGYLYLDIRIKNEGEKLWMVKHIELRHRVLRQQMDTRTSTFTTLPHRTLNKDY